MCVLVMCWCSIVGYRVTVVCVCVTVMCWCGRVGYKLFVQYICVQGYSFV